MYKRGGSLFHTAEELNKLHSSNLRNLHSDHLLDFFEKYLVSKTFSYHLSNGDKLHVFFREQDFCHLIGFHYFGQHLRGIKGWNYLIKKPVNVGRLNFQRDIKTRTAINRFKYFCLIPRLLQSPDIFIFKSEDFPHFRYKSEYFAVIKHDNRYLKLGLGKSKTDVHYPETYLVDLQDPKYNGYIDPKYQIKVNKIEITNNK